MNDKQFEQAVRLKEHAAELDYAKGRFELPLQGQAMSVAREMHKLAEALAGDRIDEVYAPSDAGGGLPA